MRAVSIPYEAGGRSNQKQRTREALVDAARELVTDGVAPTVEQAAAAAGISRTTAYRYFPNQRSLLSAAHPETALVSMLPADAPDDVEHRLDTVAATFIRMIEGTEVQQRTMLRLSLSEPAQRGELPLRQGRAIAWFSEALAPLEEQLGPDGVRELALAIRSATGIESRVWLSDIGGLQPRDVTALQRWVAGALLRAAQDEPPPVRRRRGRS
jgi:AcrR family transcriptional regulator